MSRIFLKAFATFNFSFMWKKIKLIDVLNKYVFYKHVSHLLLFFFPQLPSKYARGNYISSKLYGSVIKLRSFCCSHCAPSLMSTRYYFYIFSLINGYGKCRVISSSVCVCICTCVCVLFWRLWKTDCSWNNGLWT